MSTLHFVLWQFLIGWSDNRVYEKGTAMKEDEWGVMANEFALQRLVTGQEKLGNRVFGQECGTHMIVERRTSNGLGG